MRKVRLSIRAGRMLEEKLPACSPVMKNDFSSDSEDGLEAAISSNMARWHTFAEVVLRLHKEGIYIHPHELAEFFLRHGLPVDICYVPDRLAQRAATVNALYQGDMARLEEMKDPYWHPLVMP